MIVIDTEDDSYLVSSLKASRVHLVECLIVKGAILHSKHADAYRKLLSDNGYDNKNTPLRLLALCGRIVSTSLHFCSSTEQRIEVVNRLEIPAPLKMLLYFGVENQGAIIDGKVVSKMLYQR